MKNEGLTRLKQLAQLLYMRKEANSPYRLFLSSSIALTPPLMLQVCDTEDRRTYRSYLSILGLHDCLSILSPALLQHVPPLKSYLALARLILAGYFATALTTHTDSALEDTLDIEKDVTSLFVPRE